MAGPLSRRRTWACVYAGALTVLAIVAFGLVRGLAWAREIRFFTIAAALVLLYALGATRRCST